MPKLPELMLQMNDLQIFDTVMRRQKNCVDDNDIECYKYWFRKQGGNCNSLYISSNASVEIKIKQL